MSSTAKSNQTSSSVLWWVVWITLTILSFFISCAFWTWFIARHVGNMNQTGTPLIWVATVFGTWVIILIPLIIAMYNKVDKAYDEAKIRREMSSQKLAFSRSKFKSIFVDTQRRTLPEHLQNKLKRIPEVMKHAHLVNCHLKDGKTIEHVFILDRQEIVGLYGKKEFTLNLKDIADFSPVDFELQKIDDESLWLRLDGPAQALTS
jgi:hypothetical protein